MTSESRQRPLVYYTHVPPPAGPELLRPVCDVRFFGGAGRPSREIIAQEARDAFALCFFVPDIIDAQLLAALPRLRVVAGFGKGYDNVDVAAATARGVWVTNVPDALTDATADMAWALVLSLVRGVRAGDARVRSGRFSGWSADVDAVATVTGKILGIVGYGAIGRAVARRASGFDMRVIFTDLASGVPIDELLATADIIVLALPLSDATRHTIDARRLQLIRPTAHLVNIARGSIVDEHAVADALERGALAGYAADVFAFEDRQFVDRPQAIDARLLAAPRTLFTPHIGTATQEDRRRLALVQAGAVLDVVAGKHPSAAVNRVAAPQTA